MSDSPEKKKPSSMGEEYVVVARRYRPRTFDELIGQEHVARGLSTAIESNRVGHAYLFTGARGVGKTSCARILAKALNCQQGPTPVPCNHCDICESITAGQDVDVLEIDGASNRGIDEIRQLRQNVAIRPSRVRFKVYIIDEVHMLTKEAFNALLKTLEEPPEHVKFIFATTEPNKIPITILSRCQRFDFAGIEGAAIQTRLAQIAEAEGATIEVEALQILASRAAGSMRDSQSLLEQLLSVTNGAITADEVNSLLGIAPAKRLGKIVQHIVARDSAAALTELDEALTGGVEVGQLADQLLGFFRDVMTSAVGAPPEKMIYTLPSQASEVLEIGQQLGVQTVLAIMQILDQTVARMRVSVNSRTLTEMALVRICSLQDLDALAALVSALKQGVPIPAGPTSTRTVPRGSQVGVQSGSQQGVQQSEAQQPSVQQGTPVKKNGRINQPANPPLNSPPVSRALPSQSDPLGAASLQPDSRPPENRTSAETVPAPVLPAPTVPEAVLSDRSVADSTKENLAESPTADRSTGRSTEKKSAGDGAEQNRSAENPMAENPVAENPVAENPAAGPSPVATEVVDNKSAQTYTAASALRVWQAVCEEIGGGIGNLAGNATEIRVKSATDWLVALPNRFTINSCERPASKSRLEEQLKLHCKQRISVQYEVKETTKQAPTTRQERSRPNRWQQQTEVALRPFVKSAIDLFEADAGALKYYPPREKK